MKYVRSAQFKIKKKIPASAFVRMVFGTLFVGIALFIFIGGMTSKEVVDEALPFLAVLSLLFFLGGATFLFFGIRALVNALCSFTNTPPSPEMLANGADPFFTARCATCNALFDYQLSDLGFRPWFPNGYIECPCCEKPLRHNAVENAYIPMYTPQTTPFNPYAGHGPSL